MISELLIDVVAGYRLTRLVTADTITEGPRRAVATFAGFDVDPAPEYPVHEQVADARSEGAVPKLADLVTCRWCAGVWVGLGIVAARRLAPRTWSPIAPEVALAQALSLPMMRRSAPSENSAS